MTRVLALWSGFLVVLVPLRAPASQDDYKRDVIVRFTSHSIDLPVETEASEFNQVSIESTDLSQLLTNYETATVAPAFPRSIEQFLSSQPSERDSLLYDSISRTYVLTIADSTRCNDLIADLSQRTDVVFSERNGTAIPLSAAGDRYYQLQWNMQNTGQASGGVGDDVRAWAAWDLHQGSDLDQIGFVDPAQGESFNQGWMVDHVEFSGRIVGGVQAPHPFDHVMGMAGIAAARGNNNYGIAGLNWNARIRTDLGKKLNDLADAIYVSVRSGSRVINLSWAQSEETDPGWTEIVAEAMAYACNASVTVVVSMPASLDVPQIPMTSQYPGNYFLGKTSIGVAASSNKDLAAPYQRAGLWVDVSAPGGTTEQQACELFTTSSAGFDSYVYKFGTSFATAHVTGAAALLYSYARQRMFIGLGPEDLTFILRETADNLDIPGWDTNTGKGRINVRRALDWVGPGTMWFHQVGIGGTITDQEPDFTPLRFHGGTRLDGYSYVQAKRYTVDGNFETECPGIGPYDILTRGGQAWGWAPNAPDNTYGIKYCELVQRGVGNLAKFRTYVYYCKKPDGTALGWYPTDPAHVQFAWTTYRVNVPGTPEIPDTTYSYFVPQAGSVSAPVEGTAAARLFRGCPNNEGGASFPNNTRLKIVLRDSANQPIVGVRPRTCGFC
jgi:hypothetical protein